MANCLMSVLNFIALVVSVPLIFAARSLKHDPGHTACDRYLAPDLMSSGLFLLCLSLMWFIGSCCRMRLLLWLHLLIIFLSVIGMFVTSMSGLVAIRKGEGQVMPRRGIDDGYKVENFSPWMQKKVRDKDIWAGYRTCLVDNHACEGLGNLLDVYQVTGEQFMYRLPAQWGCCQPPKHCGYERENVTFWTIPKSGLLAPSNDPDCVKYSNHQDTLCYDCETCKAGILAELRIEFRGMFILNVGIAVFLMLVSWSACSNLREEKVSRQYVGGYMTQMP